MSRYAGWEWRRSPKGHRTAHLFRVAAPGEVYCENRTIAKEGTVPLAPAELTVHTQPLGGNVCTICLHPRTVERK